MPNWIKTLTAILLLPLCFGMAQALVHLIRVSGSAETTWVGLAAGSACWIVVYLSLPKPMRAYVIGHELTHALWAWAFGGQVKRFQASSRGGHVVVTKKNCLIALAPYFFPIYAFGVVLIFMIGHLIWDWKRYAVCFHLLLGAAYAFHVTLTWHILKSRQTDIVEQGYLFSAVVIWLGNLAVLVIAIPLLTGRVGLLTVFAWCWSETGSVLQRLAALL
jgi:hypothetical protein